jgi:uncharacterized membrane protein
MLIETVKLIGITFLPLLELRASIPYGIINGHLPWLMVVIICVIANIIIGIIYFYMVDIMFKLMLRIPVLNIFWEKKVEKTRKKIHAGVEKYGEYFLIIFIGIPLPGSGVYSGALGAYLLGMSFKKFLIANIIGVLIAAIAVTFAVLSGSEALKLFFKTI